MSRLKKQIRKKFRDEVFKRDGHRCVFCSVTNDLDAHHITDRSLMPNGGYVKENGISLCPDHHQAAEVFHISNGKEWMPLMHPDDLYIMIDSSYEIAYKASEKLGN